jgi:hypothetical protein
MLNLLSEPLSFNTIIRKSPKYRQQVYIKAPNFIPPTSNHIVTILVEKIKINRYCAYLWSSWRKLKSNRERKTWN